MAGDLSIVNDQNLELRMKCQTMANRTNERVRDCKVLDSNAEKLIKSIKSLMTRNKKVMVVKTSETAGETSDDDSYKTAASDEEEPQVKTGPTVAELSRDLQESEARVRLLAQSRDELLDQVAELSQERRDLLDRIRILEGAKVESVAQLNRRQQLLVPAAAEAAAAHSKLSFQGQPNNKPVFKKHVRFQTVTPSDRPAVPPLRSPTGVAPPPWITSRRAAAAARA